MTTYDLGGSAVSETSSTPDSRTPAQIEADIKRRRETLAETLDEIGARVHPKTIVGDAKAKVVSNIDHTLGRAYVGVNRMVSDVRGQLVNDEGAPRLERIVPVALVVVGVVGLLAVGSRRGAVSSRRGGSLGSRRRKR
ncbi:DUF3618 domain-containing protein [Streptomyces sp. CA-288835]|uniref:DUF3618 domain-containing protein n=1 Tax=Streptomyces sp. CA-288835 TaxID=3240069 RepID=UPI003D93EE22